MVDGPLDLADAAFMRRAIELAGRGRGRVAPNPMVGAVVVREGRIVGEGWHREYGQSHAEVEAIRMAGPLSEGATIYVTLEPCNHQGQTGPCTEAILASGIRRVVHACADPNPRAGGGGRFLAAHGITTVSGIEEDAARRLDPAFFHGFDPRHADRPWLELKLALSVDGKMADAAGASKWITGEAARAEVHRLRAGFDAIAVGIGTALADDPRLTVRGEIEPRVHPTRVVFDRVLRLPPDSRLARTTNVAPVWVIAGPHADPAARSRLEAAGVRVLTAPDLREGLRALRAAGVRSVFCEGGARLASALLTDDLVERLTIFRGPLLLGPDGTDPFAGISNVPISDARRWVVARMAIFGSDTLLSLDR